MNQRTDGKLRAILIGGLIGATCDILYATIFSYMRSGVPPVRILQSVASGLLGREASNGGMPVALLGLGLHYVMVLIIAAIYVFASDAIPALVRRPVICGALYGLGVYGVMNLIVLPLSRVPPRSGPMPLILLTTGIFVHMFLVGVPIAIAARRRTAV